MSMPWCVIMCVHAPAYNITAIKRKLTSKNTKTAHANVCDARNFQEECVFTCARSPVA